MSLEELAKMDTGNGVFNNAKVIKLNKKSPKDMTREELEKRVTQLEEHNQQLRNILQKSSDPSVGSSSKCRKGQKPFDFSRTCFRHVALKFAYLGWDWYGYAVQENSSKTIEAELFDALRTTKLVQSRESSNYHRCGRTDKGVSAFSQVISLTLRSRLKRGKDCVSIKSSSKPSDDGSQFVHCNISTSENDQVEICNNCRNSKNSCSEDNFEDELDYPDLLNRVLPHNIRVLSWAPVDPKFSARFDCNGRLYKYFFPRGDLNIDAMCTAADSLIGIHDFRNFCKMDVGNGVVNFTRRIDAISIDSDNDPPVQQCTNINNDFGSPTCGKNSIEEQLPNLSNSYDMFVCTIRGKAFLWHQVRSIMTVLILVGQGKERPDVITKLFDIDFCPSKPQYGLADETGLNLYETFYDDLKWIYNYKNLRIVVSQMQAMWSRHAVRSSMVKSMTNDISSVMNSTGDDNCIILHRYFSPATHYNQAASLIQETTKKVYKTLLERPKCGSLETKINCFVKRRRIDPSLGRTVEGSSNIEEDE